MIVGRSFWKLNTCVDLLAQLSKCHPSTSIFKWTLKERKAKRLSHMFREKNTKISCESSCTFCSFPPDPCKLLFIGRTRIDDKLIADERHQNYHSVTVCVYITHCTVYIASVVYAVLKSGWRSKFVCVFCFLSSLLRKYLF